MSAKARINLTLELLCLYVVRWYAVLRCASNLALVRPYTVLFALTSVALVGGFEVVDAAVMCVHCRRIIERQIGLTARLALQRTAD